jgi:nucleolin
LCFIEFNTEAEAQAALALNGAEVDGRNIRVNLDSDKPTTSRPAGSNTLFIGNLSFNTDEETLMSYFEGATSVRIPTDRETGKPKGFGYVEFASKEDAQKGFEAAKGVEIDGRAVRVDYAEEKGAGGDRGGRGGRGGFRGGDRGGRGGFDRGGRGGCFRGGRGGFCGVRGGRGGFDRGGDRGRGGRGRGRGSSAPKFEGQHATFDD